MHMSRYELGATVVTFAMPSRCRKACRLLQRSAAPSAPTFLEIGRFQTGEVTMFFVFVVHHSGVLLIIKYSYSNTKVLSSKREHFPGIAGFFPIKSSRYKTRCFASETIYFPQSCSKTGCGHRANGKSRLKRPFNNHS